VVVATPTKLHHPIVMECLRRRAHVFCEKPFSLYTSEGKEMADLATQSGRVNQVGYHNRFIGTFTEFRRLIANHVLGDVYHFSAEAYGPVVIREKSETWRSQRAEGGGCLYDYASHVINLVQFILGNPVSARGTSLKSIFSKEVEDAVFSNLTLDTGLNGQLSVNWSDETHRKMTTSLTVYGKKGKITCDATELRIYLNYDDTEEKLAKGWNIKYITDLTPPVPFYLRGEEYSSQLDYFFSCIKQAKTDNINSFSIACQTDHTIDLLFRDAKNI
jgi:predicted dehydrogenase